MRIKFATFELNGTPRISFSREEILAMKSSISEEDPGTASLLMFLDKLEEELLSA